MLRLVEMHHLHPALRLLSVPTRSETSRLQSSDIQKLLPLVKVAASCPDAPFAPGAQTTERPDGFGNFKIAITVCERCDCVGLLHLVGMHHLVPALRLPSIPTVLNSDCVVLETWKLTAGSERFESR